MTPIPSCSTCTISNCFIQQFVDKPWKKKVEKVKTASFYKKGQILFQAGNPVNGLYFIYSGKVKVYLNSPSAFKLTIRIASVGDMVGHRGLTHEQLYPVSAEVLEDSHIGFIPLPSFLDMLNHSPLLYQELMLFFMDELQRTEKKIISLLHDTVKQRFLTSLEMLKNVCGERTIAGKKYIDIALPRKEYAYMVNCSLEEIIRTISVLKKENYIQVSGKYIGIAKS